MSRPARIVRDHFRSTGRAGMTVDGHYFPSRSEARRYGALKLLEAAGRIRELAVHPRLPMVINDRKIGRGWIELDFSYKEYIDGQWRLIYEDHKPVDTRESRVRRQVAEALHGIHIKLTG